MFEKWKVIDTIKLALKISSILALEGLVDTTNIFPKDVAGDPRKKLDIVTDYDEKIEKKIVEIINERFEGHQILTEEKLSNTNSSDYRWIIDPIDGTFNFAHKNPLFGINIALEYKNEIRVAGTALPALGEYYLAFKDERSCLITGKSVKDLRVSDHPLKGSLVSAHPVRVAVDKLYNNYSIFPRCHGSVAVDCCYLAAGRIQGIIFNGLKPWDKAPGILLIKEAGGVILRGTENLEDDRLFACTSVIKEEFDALLDTVIR